MKHLLPILGAVLLALAFVVSFGIDLSQTFKSGAIDFRNRITGARLLESGIDPYHYIWHPGDPEQFCDTRNNPRMTVSKTTVSPTMLVFYSPLAALPYRTAQFVWLFMQWLLLIGTAWLWLRASAERLPVWLALLFVLGFTFTPGWRNEAERGQCYTLLVFLLAYVLSFKDGGGRRGDFIAGFVAGVLAALRAPYLVLLPFLALHRPRQLPGALAGLLAGLIVPSLLLPHVWLDYALAMQTNSDYYRHASLPARPVQAFPDVIEGTPLATMASVVYFPYVDVTVYALVRNLGLGAMPELQWILLYGGLLLAWLWGTRGRAAELLLPGMAAWLFFSDFVLPTARWGYYDVMILNVLLAEIAASTRISRAVWPGLLAVAVSWTFWFFAKVPMALLYVPQVLFVLSAVLALFPPVEREEKVDN